MQRQVRPPEEALPTGETLEGVHLEVRVEGRVSHLVDFARRAHKVLPASLRLLLDEAFDLRLAVFYIVRLKYCCRYRLFRVYCHHTTCNLKSLTGKKNSLGE